MVKHSITRFLFFFICLVFFQAISLIGYPMPQALAQTVYDLTQTIEGATYNNVEIISDGLVLTRDSTTGYYVEEGYIDIPFSGGNYIQLDATRANTLDNADFEEVLPSTSSRVVGQWMGTMLTSSGATRQASSDGTSHDLNLTYTGLYYYLAQYFVVDPGELYRLSYNFDGNSLGSGHLLVRLYVQGASLGTNLSLMFPQTWSTTNWLTVEAHTANDATDDQRFRIGIPDCNDYYIYRDPGDSTNDQIFNQYTAGKANCETAIQHASILFMLDTASTSAVLDNIFLDREDQIEVVLLNSSGDTVFSSTENTGFSTEDVSDVTKLRIYLRSHLQTRAPVVSSMIISDGIPLKVQIGDKVATFTSSRLGTDTGLPPQSEFKDTTQSEVRSQCIDFFADNGSTKQCWDFWVDSGASRARRQVGMDYLDFTWSDTTQDYEASLNSEGTHWVGRIQEGLDYGHDTLLLFFIHGDIIDFYDSSGTFLYPDWTGTRTESEQIFYLITKYAQFFAQLFDGVHGYGTIDDFEVFNEPNLSKFGASWTTLSTADLVDLTNQVAQRILEVRSDAHVAVSGLSGMDFDFLNEEISVGLVADNFTYLNFHPYIGTNVPESVAEDWEEGLGLLSSSWSSKEAFFGEYAYSHYTYHPYCHSGSSEYTYDTTTISPWYRGFGKEVAARKLARQTLTNLSLPTIANMTWGSYTPEEEGMGGGYTCYTSDPPYNMDLFDRQEGSGILSGMDEPTVYEANASGKAFLRIANQNIRSPYETEITQVGDENLPDDIHHYAQFYETVDGSYLLAFWAYREYEFLGNWSGLYYMNYIYGTKDHDDENMLAYGVYDYGWEETWRHNVELVNSPISSPTALLYHLDSSTTETVSVSTNSAGNLVLEGIEVGEMPVFIKLTPIEVLEETTDVGGIEEAEEKGMAVTSEESTEEETESTAGAAGEADAEEVKEEGVATNTEESTGEKVEEIGAPATVPTETSWWAAAKGSGCACSLSEKARFDSREAMISALFILFFWIFYFLGKKKLTRMHILK